MPEGAEYVNGEHESDKEQYDAAHRRGALRIVAAMERGDGEENYKNAARVELSRLSVGPRLRLLAGRYSWALPGTWPALF